MSIENYPARLTTGLLCAKFCYMLWVLGNTHTTEQKGSKRL